VPSRSRLVICGQSVFVMAIEARLAEFPAIEVVRLNIYMPDLLKRIITWQPDMVVLEHNQGHGDLVLALLGHNLDLIVVNAQQDRGLWLTGHTFSVSDLPQLIVAHQKS
jgi:hypothetical protein